LRSLCSELRKGSRKPTGQERSQEADEGSGYIETDREKRGNGEEEMLSNKWTFSFVSNNVCLVSLSLVYIVVAIVYSSSDHDTYLEPLVPIGAEGLPHNAGNHVYPYLASFFACMCCTGIVMVIVCYNKIMGSIGGDAVDYTRRLRFED
jgi:hypothetical protein